MNLIFKKNIHVAQELLTALGPYSFAGSGDVVTWRHDVVVAVGGHAGRSSFVVV